MVVVESHRSFNDRWSWRVSAPFPSAGINCAIARELQHASQCFGKEIHVAMNWRENFIVVDGGDDRRRGRQGISCDHNWGDEQFAAGFMKVFQVERVIVTLIKSV